MVTGTTLYQLDTFSFAPNSNITAATDSVNGTWSYTYDDLNRLGTASRTSSPAQTYTYTYDRYGNRGGQTITSGGGSGPQPNFSFDAYNHINSTGFAYDAAGNMTNDGVHAYTYDPEGRVLTVNSSPSWTYVYGADGRRIQKTDSSGNHMEDYYDVAGRLTTEYYNGGWSRSELYAGGMRLATYIGGETTFVYSDWLGNHRRYADQTASPFENCTNLPFGDGMSCDSPHWESELFTGDEHDAESNTEHTEFRQLATTQGRWFTPDPYTGSMNTGNPQSLNRYAYVSNNPVNLVDPSGLNESASCEAAELNCGVFWYMYDDGNRLERGGWGIGAGSSFGEALEEGLSRYNSIRTTGCEPNGLICYGSVTVTFDNGTTAVYGNLSNWQVDGEESFWLSVMAQQKGLVPVYVGMRSVRNPFIRILTLGGAHHAYYTVDGRTFEVLGQNGMHNQQVEETTGSSRHVAGDGSDQIVYVTPEQDKALLDRSIYYLTNTCPSCGAGYNILFHNSNSYVYNMLRFNSAGTISPPGVQFGFAPGYWSYSHDGWYH